MFTFEFQHWFDCTANANAIIIYLRWMAVKTWTCLKLNGKIIKSKCKKSVSYQVYNDYILLGLITLLQITWNRGCITSCVCMCFVLILCTQWLSLSRMCHIDRTKKMNGVRDYNHCYRLELLSKYINCSNKNGNKILTIDF